MNEDNKCPCEAVKDLQKILADHEKRLAEGNTTFALIQQDLGYIKAKLDEKQKFNGTVVLGIIQGVCSLLLGAVAIKLGLG